MDQHPEIDWSEVTRQAIQEQIETLEVLDHLTSESELTESDVQEITGPTPRSTAVSGGNIRHGRCRFRFDCRTNRPFGREAFDFEGFRIGTQM